ncbi:unnamed protein product [Eruca vesicaria subsp. sativa]|uniref:Uncharacterized protein n=1 Tax=Eruca vesicaria subsp. sativa TaxID=29727 RepID=A0ABC8L7J7_ERUVS|nr:unnamed protein product [Eruca vesicaria subsp. sativa]
MGSMFRGNRLNKEEMEVVMNKAKEIIIERLCLFTFSSVITSQDLMWLLPEGETAVDTARSNF